MHRQALLGDRVVLDGIDGPVEDIGFRSTRIRTLTGHLVAIPNEKMATINIENIGRRPSIRRLTNITITYDTPPEKVERALTIIREILENHEGMAPDFPPRVYFNEFNDASLNILMIYWYFPPNYWDFLAFNERVNLQIMRAFEEEGIEFAFPTTTTYLAHDDRRPLSITISSDPMHTESDVKKLLQFFSKERQKVLDPFVGVGSTLIACRETNRVGYGIELIPKWAEIARLRLNQSQLQLNFNKDEILIIYREPALENWFIMGNTAEEMLKNQKS